MNSSEYIFDRFSPFIKDFIYSHSWESLREVQIAAARTIFETNNNIEIISGNIIENLPDEATVFYLFNPFGLKKGKPKLCKFMDMHIHTHT